MERGLVLNPGGLFMTSNLLKLQQGLSITQRRRIFFIALIVIEIILLVIIGTKLVGIEAVEDHIEVLGNQEIVYYRNEITGEDRKSVV